MFADFHMDQERLLLEDTLLEGDTLELVGDILDLDILVVVGCMEEAEDTETEQNRLEDLKGYSVEQMDMGLVGDRLKNLEVEDKIGDKVAEK